MPGQLGITALGGYIKPSRLSLLGRELLSCTHIGVLDVVVVPVADNDNARMGKIL
jgi:hypothetical protein